MYPDLKFMTTEDDDIVFAPFSVDESFELRGLPLISEDLVNSSNPLAFDFRDVLLDSKIENADTEIAEILSFRGAEDFNSNELFSYNRVSNFIDDDLDIQAASDLLRFIDLDVDEETLELEEHIDSVDLSDARTYKKCKPELVFRKIKRNNPNILRIFDYYRIPYPIYKRLMKRIIFLSLKYCKEGR